MIRTARLILRQWRDEDLAPFAAMNAGPIVREYFAGTLDRAASDASVGRMRSHIDRNGFGFWAAELAGTGAFAGFVGIAHVPPTLPFAPAVELGWRLARAYWGCGYATEAARASADHGLRVLRLTSLVAYAVHDNRRSIAVMERLGMAYAGAFDHDELPPGDRNRPHVLYRLGAAS